MRFILRAPVPAVRRFTKPSRLAAFPVYKVFPASLSRLNAGGTFRLFEFERHRLNESFSPQESIHTLHSGSMNGNNWTEIAYLDNGSLMPNTFTMQEIIRLAVDNYHDDLENGIPAERPYVFTIRKGTRVPEMLVLQRPKIAQFSLHLSLSANTQDQALDDFYKEFADKRDACDWLDNHKFEEASTDDAEKEWMKL